MHMLLVKTPMSKIKRTNERTHRKRLPVTSMLASRMLVKRYLVVWAGQTLDKFVRELKSNPAVVVVSLRGVHMDVMSLVAHLDADEAQWGIILCRVASSTIEAVRRDMLIVKCTSNN